MELVVASIVLRLFRWGTARGTEQGMARGRTGVALRGAAGSRRERQVWQGQAIWRSGRDLERGGGERASAPRVPAKTRREREHDACG